MRLLMVGLFATALTACGESEENKAAADQEAVEAGFTPPVVTSRVDWGGRAERRFRDLDRNGDDKLTPDEFPRADSRVAALDRNGDGEITAQEFNEGAIARFDRMDLNRDGTVTSEEQDTSRNGAAPARPAR